MFWYATLQHYAMNLMQGQCAKKELPQQLLSRYRSNDQ